MNDRRVPRFPAEAQVPASALLDKVWAVIGDHYVAFDMTYAEARDHAVALKQKKQPGVVTVTNEAARRMMAGSDIGISVQSLPDAKF